MSDALGQDEVVARVRQMSWKAVVRLLKDTVEAHHRPKELPQVVLDWFDFNRAEPESDEEAGAQREQMEGLRSRLEQFGELAAPAFRDNYERAPIGPWWVEMRHYLRDGRRWWLLRAYHDSGADAHSRGRDDLRRLRKIVDYAGGVSRRLLIDAGDSLLWTWRAE